MEVVSNRIMGLGRSNEVSRNEAGPLVDKLVEGMLAIGARLTPHNGACLVLHRAATPCHIPSRGRWVHYNNSTFNFNVWRLAAFCNNYCKQPSTITLLNILGYGA